MRRVRGLRRFAAVAVLAVVGSSSVAACTNPIALDDASCHTGADSLDDLMAKVAIAGVAHDRQRVCALIPDGWTISEDSLREFGRDLDGNADIDWVPGTSQGPLTPYTLLDPDGVELTELRVVAANGRFFALLGTEPNG